jgi:nucleoid-associated protein YgaU
MFAKVCVLAVSALLVWSVVARPSGAHGPRTLYRVEPYDTLWTIASARYAGDVQGAIWQIESANHLQSELIQPGQTLMLP